MLESSKQFKNQFFFIFSCFAFSSLILQHKLFWSTTWKNSGPVGCHRIFIIFLRSLIFLPMAIHVWGQILILIKFQNLFRSLLSEPSLFDFKLSAEVTHFLEAWNFHKNKIKIYYINKIKLICSKFKILSEMINSNL